MSSRIDITGGSVNPANEIGSAAVPVEKRQRMSMALPRLKLEIPPDCCPGYHLEWILGSASEISRALNGGFEFVTPEEVHLNNVSFAGDVNQSGSTDLGNRVSVSAGATGSDQASAKLYLMKLREEWYAEDNEIRAERQRGIVANLTAGAPRGEQSRETEADISLRYIDKRVRSIPDLFKPKPQRRP